jgi:hypothetical protein
VTKGEIIGGLVPHRVMMVGESLPIILVFWIELDPRPYMLSTPVDSEPIERRLAVAS